jgi:hypothetical protein
VGKPPEKLASQEPHMSNVVRLYEACDGTCETTTGCRCHPTTRQYVPAPTPDYVAGPTDWDALDNPYTETEQSMRAASWFALLLIALGAAAAALAALYLAALYLGAQ